MNNYKVYLLECPIEGKIKYVGITSQDVKKRYKRHLAETNQNPKTEWFKSLKKQNLQPILKLVESNLSFLAANQIEQKLIKKYNKDGHLTNSFIDGKHQNKISAPNRRPVLQYSFDGKFVRRFESTHEAVKHFNKPTNQASDISRCCNGQQKTAYGYIWKYESPKLEKKPFKNKKNLVAQYSVDNKCLAIYISVPIASSVTGIDSSDIYKCCKGKRKTVSSYVWKYINL